MGRNRLLKKINVFSLFKSGAKVWGENFLSEPGTRRSPLIGGKNIHAQVSVVLLQEIVLGFLQILPPEESSESAAGYGCEASTRAAAMAGKPAKDEIWISIKIS